MPGYPVSRFSALANTLRKVLDAPTGRDLSIRRLFAEFMTALEEPDVHALANTPFARTYVYDKVAGSADITKHLAAALYTQSWQAM
jgi:hypothetical protein